MSATPTARLSSCVHLAARAAAIIVVIVAVVGLGQSVSVAPVAMAEIAETAAAESESDTATAAEQQLAERHAPIVVLRTQLDRCGPGEPYVPVAVDAVLGHPDVVLVGPDGERLIAPGADDLAGRGDGWYLDFPGNALRPGCAYEQFSDDIDASPTMYARVVPTEAVDDGDAGLALQYWFFYVYNDWNDRHEGDWEMIQLVFDAPDAQAALSIAPSTVAFAQHEGAELSDWADGPLQVRDGARPLVFAGQGSHASYFRADEWFGKSAQSGFGCDDTSAPSTEIEPDVVLLDDTALPQWLAFEGRWGERRPSFNNGPTGPNTKEQWNEPRRWIDDGGRYGSVALPAGGSSVTDFFCRSVAAGSKLMFRTLDQPGLVAGVGVLAAVALVLLVRRTRWAPVVMPPAGAHREGGQILRTAVRVVRTHPMLFGRLGAMVPIAGLVATLAQAALLAVTGFGPLAGVLGRDSLFGGLLATAIGGVIIGPVAAVAATAAMEAARHPEAERPGLIALGRSTLAHRRAIAVQLVLFAILLLGFVFVVLVPFALWWQARSAVAVPAAIDGTAPWRRSAVLTSGHRLRALAITWTATAIGVGLPLVVGLTVLLVSSASFVVVNLIAGLVGFVTTPLAAVVTQLQYDDLLAREQLGAGRQVDADEPPAAVAGFPATSPGQA